MDADLVKHVFVYSPRLHATDCELRVLVETEGDAPVTATRVIGPFCVYQRTVPETYTSATHARQSAGVTEFSVLIPEPCFWTPESPFLYRLDLLGPPGFGGGPRPVATLHIGLRHLRVRNGQLELTGKLWQPRGIYLPADPAERAIATPGLLDALRSGRIDLLIGPPCTAEFARQCSETGVALFIALPPDAAAVETVLRELRNEAAVLAWLVSPSHGDAPLAVVRALDPVRPCLRIQNEPLAIGTIDDDARPLLLPDREATLDDLVRGALQVPPAPGRMLMVRPTGR